MHSDLNEEYYRDYITNELTHYKFSTRLVDEDYVVSYIKKQRQEEEEAIRLRKEEEYRLMEEHRRKEEEFILAEERRRVLHEKIRNERHLQEQEELERKQEIERIKQESYVATLERNFPKIDESSSIRSLGHRNLQATRNRTAAEPNNTVYF